MTVDALTIYRQSILIWGETPDKAFDLATRFFGEAEATAARDAYNTFPSLRELND